MTPPLDHLAAGLAERYRIERELGAGGMATVCLAQDLKHDRKVALKVLRPELAAMIGAERFLAEIRTTANLQHPHILALFDSGQVDGTVFYAMPFVDGESLRDRLNREKQLPIADALRIATEVADALQYAHDHGVIHRDIKPENILLHSGHALVADFGIALAAGNSGGNRMTETGMSLGTPTYMSPEQAMGERTLDARTDVYALGCVLYEMLVGEPPFTGATVQQVVAKVLTEQPAGIVARRDRVPPHVEDAVLIALSKLPADRFASAAELARALAQPSATIFPRGGAASRRAPWPARWQLGVAALAVTAVSAAGGWLLGRRGAPRPDGVTRLALSLGGAQIGPTALGFRRVAWAPDGRAFVYAGFDGSRTQLWVRSLDALTPTLIPGTDGASNPSFSPDGSQIAFTRLTPLSLNVIPRAGGKATTIVTGNDVSAGGTDWADDGYIYFDAVTSISRVRPDGTNREVVFALDTVGKEVGFGSVQALPHGRGVIARTRRASDDFSAYTIVAYDASTRRRKTLVTATFARYAPSGHLLYVTSDGTLMASRMNLERLELTGTPVVVARGLGVGQFGAADLAVSSTGALLYATGRGATTAIPTWITRDGKSAPVDPQSRDVYANSVSISPDGSRIAIALSAASNGSSGRTEDIWVKGLPSGPLSRLTFEGEQNRRPRWSHDGRNILFISNRAGLGAVYRQRADGSSPAERLASLPSGVGLGLESPDGRWLVLQREENTAGPGIYAMRVGIDREPKPLIESTFNDLAPDLSPDGRWIAYQSDETGRPEVYVRPFPDVNAGKVQVSSDGGSAPRWSRRGGELFFETPAQDMMVAQVRSTPAFAVLGQKRLYSWLGYGSPYDVAPDDQRFLMLQTGGGATLGDALEAAQLVLVQNFLSELKRTLP